jgi:hypothetical protein
MKHVLLSLCLTAAVVSTPTVHFTRGLSLEGDIPMGMAIQSTLNCTPSTEVVIPPSQHEFHAVVVDMPQHASLEHASPETWGTLPTFDPPYEQTPATGVTGSDELTWVARARLNAPHGQL